jgi:hypothetical protein
MYYATPHMNCREDLHVFLNFLSPFLSPDAAVLPVQVTTHTDCGLICVYHPLYKNCQRHQLHLASNLKIQLLCTDVYLWFHTKEEICDLANSTSFARHFQSSFQICPAVNSYEQQHFLGRHWQDSLMRLTFSSDVQGRPGDFLFSTFLKLV